jgi:hypothetical protein
MSDTWYYSEAEKPVGPISLEELKRILSKMKDWRKKLVWNASLNEWREAGTVPELDVVEPPPIPKQPPKPKWWLRWVSIGVGLIAFIIVKELTKPLWHELFSTINQPSASDIETALTLTESKAQVPQKLDEMTTLVGVKHTGVKELTYFYELDTKNYNIPPGAIVPLRKMVASKVCAQMKETLNLGVVYVYRYRDATGGEFGQFALNQNDCK